MQRVYGVVEEELVHRIDEAAGEEKVSRAQWIRDAIEAYLHRPGEDLFTEAVNLRQETVNLRTALGEKDQEIAHLKETLTVKDGELVHLQSIKDRYDQAMTEATQRWEELRGLRGELSLTKRELEGIKGISQKSGEELARLVTETERLRAELENTKVKAGAYLEALKIKDDEIAFLRGHVSQLTQQITPALPPSQEEARAKHWWQFWRRG
jgi:chromosome segregation ATPase